MDGDENLVVAHLNGYGLHEVAGKDVEFRVVAVGLCLAAQGGSHGGATQQLLEKGDWIHNYKVRKKCDMRCVLAFFFLIFLPFS